MMITKALPKRVSGKIICLAILGVVCLVLTIPSPLWSADDFTVTLLGTGMPTPSPDRFGPSTLVEGKRAAACFRYRAGRQYPPVAEADSSRHHRRSFIK
jgi:hypothetical protein